MRRPLARDQPPPVRRPAAPGLTVDGFRGHLLRIAGIWRPILVVVLGLLAGGVAIAYGVPALPVAILFVDLLVFWHLRLLAAERRRAAALDAASFRAASAELDIVKTMHRDRLAPAQGSLPFGHWLAEVRAGRPA